MHKEESNIHDLELVKRAIADPNEFEKVVEKYWGPLARFVRRISSSSNADIEDVLQDSFVKAYLNLNSFDESYKLSTWLYQIVRNSTIDAFRKNKSHFAISQIEDKEIEELFASSLDMEKDSDLKRDVTKLRVLIAQLSTKYQEVMVLKFLEHKSYDEIMDIVKKPKGTVAALINRGRKILKNRFEEENI